MQSKSPFDAEPQPGSAATPELAPVIRLRPIRTLVISPDLAYRDRAWTVLSELGPVVYTVASLDEPEDIACLLAQERADVVLLDATACEAAAGNVVAALAASAPRTGVVVVCQHCTPAARALQALPKWGWTQDLRAAVELAYREGNPLCPTTLSALRRRASWKRMAGPLPRHS